MHNFEDLIYRSAAFSLNSLEEINSKIIKELQTNASTVSIKNLQMINLQKVILSIGMFSLFDSILQNKMSCHNGFKEAKEILIKNGEIDLYNDFNIFISAINTLKHGKGKSYNFLTSKNKALPFIIKMPNEDFFEEGDVSEVSTLIKVDDDFVLNCASIIEKVSKKIKKYHPIFD